MRTKTPIAGRGAVLTIGGERFRIKDWVVPTHDDVFFFLFPLGKKVFVSPCPMPAFPKMGSVLISCCSRD